MKKFMYSVLAAATMLFATTSCSQEEEMLGGEANGNNTQKVSFTVQLPDEDATSRTLKGGAEVGKGNMANKLRYALYEVNDQGQIIEIEGVKKPLKTGSVTETQDKNFTVSLDMVKGLKYKILFLAYNEGEGNCIFNLENDEDGDDLMSLELNTDLSANKEAYDAFVACHPYNTIATDRENTVKLNRPFAQINVGTTHDDYLKAQSLNVEVSKSKLVIENVPNNYNVFDGTTSATIESLIYKSENVLENVRPAQDAPAYEVLKVNDNEYYNLNMVYVLAGTNPNSQESTHKATFTFYRDAEPTLVRTLVIEHLPIHRNYRTNVIGNLLTQEESFEIVIDEKFVNDHNVNPSGQRPIDETGLKYILSNANNGDVIEFADNITLSEALTIPEDIEVTLNLNGKTLTGSILAPNADLTIENGTFENGNSAVSAIEINVGELTLNNVNIESARHAVRIDGNVTATINGGTYEVGTTSSNGTYHAVNVSGNANVTINGGEFKGPKGTSADSGSAVNVQSGATVTINGGNFSGGKNKTLAAGGTLTVYGGTFDQDPSAYLADGYLAVQNNDNTYTVLPGEDGVIPNTTITLTKAATPQEGGNIYLNSSDDFKKLGELITNWSSWTASSRATNDFNYRHAWKVVLNSDVDLNNEEWTPVNIGAFGGFDGQNHTISNLKINGTTRAALFSTSHNNDNGVCPIENLVIDGANITGTEIVAVVVGWAANPVSNITVKNAVVNGAKYVGGIVGKANSSVENCIVDNSEIKASDKEVGGIVGFLQVENQNVSKTALIANCTVTETTSVYGNDEVGGIVGRAYAMYDNKIELNNNTADATVTAGSETQYVGNIMGRDYDGTGVTVDGVTIKNASTQDGLDAAINAENKVALTLGKGNYTLPAISGKDVKIEGDNSVVITIGTPGLYGTDLTLKGVTVKGSGYATGVQHVNTVTYDNAKIVGEMCLYGEKVVFNGCTFELSKGQYIWTYGAKEVEFINCVFNTAGKAILVYNEGAGANKVTVNGCTFNATEEDKAGAIANQSCAAIEIDNYQTSGTGAAHEVITSGNTHNTKFSGEWRIKNYVTGNVITVNGAVYTTIAIDGKKMTIDDNKNVNVAE